METIRMPSIIRETIKIFRQRGKTVGLVPTMGALHNGHLALVRRSSIENDATIVSIFVNPLQFGANEDFAKYPRNISDDKDKLKEIGNVVLFMPDDMLMYPKGYSTYIDIGEIGTRLCGKYRPGHFNGVATVVCKLLNLIKPDRAYFGLKDYQQIVIIKKLVNELNMDIDILTAQTVREYDGLAMSSRNAYLNSEERKDAQLIYKALKTVETQLLDKSITPADVQSLMESTLRTGSHVKEIQYASIFDHETLIDISTSNVNNYKGKKVLLAAAVIIGSTRLIDNLLIEL
ncbi:MAG: pantoate--beta-alanine ligase [Nitrospirae bacterium]|nr:pantoate--beta-alanine ligase [Nitrospirota bacterium]MBF0539968.1 pantoate--beta-alanine ligase [Nitrospirota bacterium]